MAQGKKHGPTPGTEATKHGGQATRDQYGGTSYYRRIGQKGGAALSARIGPDGYRALDQRGGATTKARYGEDYWLVQVGFGEVVCSSKTEDEDATPASCDLDR